MAGVGEKREGGESMSVKAMGLVWDLECPTKYNGVDFRPSHKFTLLAYADHADHHGKNIYPAVKTISNKTGLDERTVQRLTSDLEAMGLLTADGHGPRGTNKWFLPYDEGGWRGVTPGTVTGDKNQKSLGDIPSGDIPSGDMVPPELKELNLTNLYINKDIEVLWDNTKIKLKEDMPRASFDTWLRDVDLLGLDDRTLVIAVRNEYARDWLINRVKTKAQDLTGYYVEFVVTQPEAEQ